MKVNGMGGIDPIKNYMSQLQKRNAGENDKISTQDRGDTLEISAEAKKMQNYKGMLDKIPAVREDLVASLKQKIENGSYRPDSEKIAAGIVEERRLDKVNRAAN